MLPLDLRDTSAVCIPFIHIDSWVLIRNGINYIYIHISKVSSIREYTHTSYSVDRLDIYPHQPHYPRLPQTTTENYLVT